MKSSLLYLQLPTVTLLDTVHRVVCEHIKQTMIKTKTVTSTDLGLNNEALDDLLPAPMTESTPSPVSSSLDS